VSFVQSNGSNYAEPDHCTHRKKLNDESASIRLQIKPQHNHSPPKNNEWPTSEEKLISILVLLDFSKAFDSVDHQLLCSKLSWQNKFSTSTVNLIRLNAMRLDRKSHIRDPASRIWCRTGISIKPTAIFTIHQRYHERYCIMSISPVCRQRTTLHQLPSCRLCWFFYN
jgi:hypothetical protein